MYVAFNLDMISGTYMYTSSDSFLMYICFFRMSLNQSTISGSISMSPSPSENTLVTLNILEMR